MSDDLEITREEAEKDDPRCRYCEHRKSEHAEDGNCLAWDSVEEPEDRPCVCQEFC